MSDASHKLFDHSFHSASAVLPPCCLIEFQRLCKLIQTGADRFQLIVVDCRDERLRERVIASLDEVFGATRPSTRVVLGASAVAEPTEFSELEAQLRAAAKTHDILHLVGGSRWLDTARWESFNIRREALAQSVRASLLCWLDAEAIADMAHIATDLWAWRTGVIEFRSETAAALPPAPTRRPDSSRLSLSQRARRIAELKSTLDAHPDLPADSDFDLSIELGTLLQDIGRITDAEAHFRALAARFAGDAPRHARASFELARVIERRGEFDEALRLLEGEVLPAFERLGDVRSKAVTMGEIADILEARGDLDEALRIRQEEQLPVYEHLGDLREKAVTMGAIADILQVRGQLDEALRIREKDELPVYERLGDLRAKAVTMGKVADILQVRGQLDEALALHEQRLPIAERLGDIDSVARIRYSRAGIRLQRGDQSPEALQQILDDLEAAFTLTQQLGRADGVAASGESFARVLASQGETRKALEVLDVTEFAWRTLDDKEGLTRINALRASLIAQVNPSDAGELAAPSRQG